MNILLVSAFAPPILNAETILIWKTVSELSKKHHITVLTSSPSSSSIQDNELIFPPNVRVVYTPAYKPNGYFFRRSLEKTIGFFVDEEMLWSHLSFLHHSIDFSNFDLVYSRSHPGISHILAMKIANKYNLPWVAQFSDPWAQNPYDTHTFFRRYFDRRGEQHVLNNASFLIFPTKEISQLYGSQKNSAVLSHHYMPELYSPTQDKKELSSVKKIGYFGDFYGIRSPKPLLDGFRILQQKRPDLLSMLSVYFTGNIAKKFIPLLNLSPIPIQISKTSYFHSLHQMTKMDFLLLMDAPAPDEVNIFLPSKLMDYIGARKPILGITSQNGTTADILRNLGHLVVSPTDSTSISMCIEHLLTKPINFSSSIEQYSTEKVVQQLEEIFFKLIKDFHH